MISRRTPLILFAILQFGIVFNNYIQVTAAAREGARKAAVSRSLGTSAAETAATAPHDIEPREPKKRRRKPTARRNARQLKAGAKNR